jgi:transglutaminase 1
LIITEEAYRLRVNPEDYLDKLVDYSMLKIYTVATVKETQQTWSAEDDFVIDKPALQLEVRAPRPLLANQAFGLEIRLQNPLQKYLTDCRLSIESPGITNGPLMVRLRDIGPKETFVHVEQLIGRKFGPRNVVVVFHSRELNDVVGSRQIEIFPN